MTYLKYFLLSLFLISSHLASNELEPKLEIVVSFSILEDLVKNIGGDHVRVTSIVPPDSDAHVYQPTPDIPSLISRADLIVMNGLGFEGWIARLLETAHYLGPVVIATQGIQARYIYLPLKSARVADPHAWHNVHHVIKYIQNISQALIQVDPQHQKFYQKQTEIYLQKLIQLDQWIHNQFSIIPKLNRKIISSHDAFGYFAARYDVIMYALQGTNTESEPSAKQIAGIIDRINHEKIKALFAENITNHQLIQQVAHETNIAIGGILYSDALSKSPGPATTYIQMMQYNVKTMIASLSQKNLN